MNVELDPGRICSDQNVFAFSVERVGHPVKGVEVGVAEHGGCSLEKNVWFDLIVHFANSGVKKCLSGCLLENGVWIDFAHSEVKVAVYWKMVIGLINSFILLIEMLKSV